MFRFRIVLAHFVILFAVGIKLVLYRFLIIILLHDNMLLFPLSTNTTIREPFFEKLENKRHVVLSTCLPFSEQLQRKEIHIIQNKNILIFSYRKNSYFKIINRNEYDLSNAILHTLFYLSTKMNDHNNVFPTYFARSYFNYSSL